MNCLKIGIFHQGLKSISIQFLYELFENRYISSRMSWIVNHEIWESLLPWRRIFERKLKISCTESGMYAKVDQLMVLFMWWLIFCRYESCIMMRNVEFLLKIRQCLLILPTIYHLFDHFYGFHIDFDVFLFDLQAQLALRAMLRVLFPWKLLDFCSQSVCARALCSRI